MTSPHHADATASGRAAADAIVLHADHGAREANPYYVHRAREHTAELVKEIHSHKDPRLSAAADELLNDPASLPAWRRLQEHVTAAIHASPDGTAPLVRAAWHVMTTSRLGYHIGNAYDPQARPAPDWQSWPARPPAPTDTEPVAHIVIPFRDHSQDQARARNLTACLAALGDQTMPRERYHVTVVESDTVPRWRETALKYADEWLHAPSDRPFNKCWTVNCGVLRARRHAPLLCVLDADALVDQDFVRRNTDRFQRPGTGGFMCFRDLLYMDPAATAAAVHDRCVHRRAEPDPDKLRWFAVQRSPGLCVWLRRDVFDTVGGMDERFEGWGREDIDFILRLQLATAFDHYDDPMLHLYHPSTAQLNDGQTVNNHIPLLSWTPTEPIGLLERFTP
ncbi:glycosyltransferase family 2 protein [Streptomyces camelliae]|uniref:Galactosyltransferase-related protein n=1 Tax=Streptomyces camelliae TaxID=3004093 RepID=A0ABY7PGU0_9ACTN|nr:galactosyltransferase-related protein [Streptomyces sp. HUAS 2-6]WBO69622.1 galactosyltransferase-related protein [Streptomyces sp. HUAS 2-6]